VVNFTNFFTNSFVLAALPHRLKAVFYGRVGGKGSEINVQLYISTY